MLLLTVAGRTMNDQSWKISRKTGWKNIIYISLIFILPSAYNLFILPVLS